MESLRSVYIQRAQEMPRQRTKGSWKVSNNYVTDTAMLRFAPIEDDAPKFSHSQKLNPD